jgi:uncharacterized protein with PIN domain
VRLYADQDSLTRSVVRSLRLSGVDVATSWECGNSTLSDEEQLLFATSQGRVLYTANTRDFARLHRDWWRSGRVHAGIIYRANQDMSIGDQIRGLLELLESVDDWRGQARYL